MKTPRGSLEWTEPRAPWVLAGGLTVHGHSTQTQRVVSPIKGKHDTEEGAFPLRGPKLGPGQPGGLFQEGESGSLMGGRTCRALRGLKVGE